MSTNETASAARAYLEYLCRCLDRGQPLVRRRHDWWAGFAAMPVVVGATALSCAASTPTPSNPGVVQARCHAGPDDAVNCHDPDCAYLCQGAEYAAPVPLEAHESKCTDGIDNDGDGRADCGDPDCATMCSVPAYAAPPPVVRSETNCTNGMDDDGDGMVDCRDRDCEAVRVCMAAQYAAPMPTLTEVICTNGADDDGDGLIDRADPDCRSRMPPYPAPMYAAPM